MKYVILHIPHNNTKIPSPSEYISQESLLKDINYLTDWFTGDLYAPMADYKDKVIPIAFPVSRIYCDVERFFDNAKEIMLQKGMGYIYTHTIDGILNRENVDVQYINKLYWRHHKKLLRTINKYNGGSNEAILLDCHSFSSNIDGDCDINIGFNKDSITMPDDDLLNKIVNLFKDHNLRVKINKPYSGTMEVFKSTKFPYKSIMIEVNKSLYMDESNTTKRSDFYKYHSLMNELYKLILDL